MSEVFSHWWGGGYGFSHQWLDWITVIKDLIECDDFTKGKGEDYPLKSENNLVNNQQEETTWVSLYVASITKNYNSYWKFTYI
jgi:hypothetical protein